MNLNGLLSVIPTAASYRRLRKQLRLVAHASTPSVWNWGLLEAARPPVIAALQNEWTGPILVLATQPERARYLQEQVSLWLPSAANLWYFPAPDSLFYDRTPWAGETIRRRVTVLSALADGDYRRPPMIFTSAWALMTTTVPPDALRPGIQRLKSGQTLRLKQLLEALVAYAYEPASVVEEVGTFAQRGGILDVYPPNLAEPVRIEWLGDEIESIRAFDPMSQRSLSRMDEITIYPASEALATYAEAACATLSDLYARESLQEALRWQRDQELLRSGEYFRGLEAYLSCLYPKPTTLLEYLPSNVLVVVDDAEGVDDAAQHLEVQAEGLKAELLEQGQLPAAFPLPYRPWQQLQADLAPRVRVCLGHRLRSDADLAPEEEDTNFHSAPGYGGRFPQLLQDCLRSKAAGSWTVIVSRQAERIANLFAEADEPVVPVEDLPRLPPAGSISLVTGALAEGWVLREEPGRGPSSAQLALTLLTDAEVFGWARAKQRPFTRKKAASPESFFAELRAGDHVVHIDHGVGIYRGLVHKTVDDEPREYLEVEYEAGDRLYVPVSQMDRITRYIGSSERTPTVHRLGAADWLLVRSRAKKAVQDIAKELLGLYAAREVVQGHAFAADGVWQQELEGSFPYQETEDQMRALAEVKADMERPRPMDRLICGDVGYGKTEVAVRAAFKAVMDGKQVAVLVPTTVLAQQHMLTLQERFAAFPVQVTMLSRFCSPKEQAEAVQKLREGQMDVVVGTHRLLQKDVAFKDLGLLIVDEEQRFGVRHKEWLKKMRQHIDVLTMTATPIPRTLYMSLSGVRDMSVIDTPPEERLPVRTQVGEFDEGLVRRAILRELNRNGQVYFVHNRVQGIRQIAQRLQKIVPEATIAIGHGQMPEDTLSRVMLDFAAGKADVLVCTSIIESGLDIPNVNTIIINRADWFGLAQLYQLRGRVGRSTMQAYAYLLYDRGHKLSDVARRRLETILEASELGAGFRIAMRDLELRGAGDLLGSEQHGHIAAIGLELYTRLLSQAVGELKQAKPQASTAEPEIALPPLVELPLRAYLPDDYVPDEALRIRLYQRMTAVDREDQLEDMRKELEDRFGLLPPAVENLLYVLRVRLLAAQAGVQSVGREDATLVLKLEPRTVGRAQPVVARFGRRAWLGRGQVWLALQGQERGDWRTVLVSLLAALGSQDNPRTAQAQGGS